MHIKKNEFIKIIFLAVLTFSLSACSYQEPTSQKKPSPPQVETKIPEYQYPDETFNTNFSKDERGNYYFISGRHVYKMDNNSKVTPISKRFLKNKYLISSCRYYNNSLYLYITCCNQTKEKGLCIARMNTDGTNFRILFRIDPISSFPLIYFADHLININTISSSDGGILHQYSLEEPYTYIGTNQYSIFEDRRKYVEKYYPMYRKALETEYIPFKHLYKEKVYFTDSSHYHDKQPKTNKIVELDLNTNERVEYTFEDFDEIYYFDLLDEKWFISSKGCIYQYNFDFTKKKIITPKNDSYTYVLTPGNDYLKIKEIQVE